MGAIESSRARLGRTPASCLVLLLMAVGWLVGASHAYAGLAKLGYRHRPRKQAGAAPEDQLLPRVNRAISNLKAWVHGTHRGVSKEHLPVYLDEFAVRHNRRGSPMAAFQTLLGLGAIHDPTTYDEITALRRVA